MTVCGVAHAWAAVCRSGEFTTRIYSRHSWGRFLARLGVRKGKLVALRRSIPLQRQRHVDIQAFVEQGLGGNAHLSNASCHVLVEF